MRLPFLRPKPDAGNAARPAGSGSDAGALQQARTQARRRLIGALVLLVAAVVGFPLLFETQPRPLPGTVPIEGGPLVMRDAAPPAAAAVTREPARAGAASSAIAAPDAPATVAAASAPMLPAKAASAAVAAPDAATPKPAVEAAKPGKPDKADKPDKAEKPAALPPAPPAAASASAAQKTVETTTADAAARWVVQVGAYNDMERMRQARQKAEKLGFKTYTTEVDTPTGRRTRVRLGPFASQKEAEAAAAKVKAAGMAANVLSL